MPEALGARFGLNLPKGRRPAVSRWATPLGSGISGPCRGAQFELIAGEPDFAVIGWRPVIEFRRNADDSKSARPSGPNLAAQERSQKYAFP